MGIGGDQEQHVEQHVVLLLKVKASLAPVADLTACPQPEHPSQSHTLHVCITHYEIVDSGYRFYGC